MVVTGSAVGLRDRFCWTRFGTEAGQTIDAILDRKERERLVNGGVFLWGIGNSVWNGVNELVRYDDQPEVVFSPIKGNPRKVDVEPRAVVAWTAAQTAEGEPYDLPPGSLVLSGDSAAGRKRCHYALVCFSPSPLVFDQSQATLPFDRLRNLCSGNPVGMSQVTAIVALSPFPAVAGPLYSVAFRATLTYPYFVRLREPVLVLGQREQIPALPPAH